MKGQVQVFEQVLLFFIGVLIFMACFVAFNAYQDYFVTVGNSDQMMQVRDYIGYAIFKASMTGDESYTTLDIPQTIGGEGYTVRLSEDGLNIMRLPSGETSDTSLYGLAGTMEFGGSASSSSGRVVLYKNGNKIIIT